MNVVCKRLCLHACVLHMIVLCACVSMCVCVLTCVCACVRVHACACTCTCAFAYVHVCVLWLYIFSASSPPPSLPPSLSPSSSSSPHTQQQRKLLQLLQLLPKRNELQILCSFPPCILYVLEVSMHCGSLASKTPYISYIRKFTRECACVNLRAREKECFGGNHRGVGISWE